MRITAAEVIGINITDLEATVNGRERVELQLSWQVRLL